MATNVVNQVPYLRTSRNFPEELQPLVVEINKSYLDIAGFVNDRIIGIFPGVKPAITGERWFLTKGQNNQTQRQVFMFSDSNLTQNHNIQNFDVIPYFTRIWGTFFDGTNWNTLPYVDVVAADNQINIQVNSTQIVVTKGAGAPPAISKGIVILEWMSQP